jgi:diguanylate cyclase (GGDEF)-like protein
LTIALATIGAASAAAGVGVYEELFGNRSSATRWFGALLGGALVGGYLGWIVIPLIIRQRTEAVQSANHALTEQMRKEARRRAFGDELDHALAQAETEADVLAIVELGLHRLDAERPVELHLVDPHRPVLVMAFSSFDAPPPSLPISPWDSLAARTGKTVTYDTTARLDTCSHLASRVEEPASAICVPVTVMGRILGVLYALGPNNSEPTDSAVDAMTMVANRTGSHIAVVRSLAADPQPRDPLTGLPNEHSTKTEIRSLVETLTPFTIAIGSIDRFDQLLDEDDRTISEQAVVSFSSILSEATRPEDTVGRLSDEELIAVFPHTTATAAVRVVERVRENLALHFAESVDPNFTISFGIADSSSGSSIDQIIDNARDALTDAQAVGCSRVIVTEIPYADVDLDLVDPDERD